MPHCAKLKKYFLNRSRVLYWGGYDIWKPYFTHCRISALARINCTTFKGNSEFSQLSSDYETFCYISRIKQSDLMNHTNLQFLPVDLSLNRHWKTFPSIVLLFYSHRKFWLRSGIGKTCPRKNTYWSTKIERTILSFRDTFNGKDFNQFAIEAGWCHLKFFRQYFTKTK